MVTSSAREMVVASIVAISLSEFLDRKKAGTQEPARHGRRDFFRLRDSLNKIMDKKPNVIPDALIKIIYSLKSD